MAKPLKVFFDVDGVLIDGWHSNPSRRKPWDVTLEDDLGVNSDLFRQAFFVCPSGSFNSPMHACVCGDRDLKDALGEVLPRIGYKGSIEAFVKYWFEKDSNINSAVLDVVKSLKQSGRVDLTF